jgi:hypothetical protein
VGAGHSGQHVTNLLTASELESGQKERWRLRDNSELAIQAAIMEIVMYSDAPPSLSTRTLVTALLLSIGVPSASARSLEAAQPDTRKMAGTEVNVSAEMTGAGIVSSGVTLPPIPPVTGNRNTPVPSWGKPLPYPVVIADRRNNRLIEIAPDKRIVWEFASPNLKVYRGNEDVNFSPDGKLLAVSEEDNFDVHLVDYAQKALIWTYGTPDVRGKAPGFLNYPDDAHLLADGKFITADIRNCRILIIDPKDSSIGTQWGTPGKCRHNPPHELGHPNGATPLENGDILVTEIAGAWISRITREGNVLWSVKAPNIRYPSDAFMTVDGKQVIVADFWKPGRIVNFRPCHTQDQLGILRQGRRQDA